MRLPRKVTISGKVYSVERDSRMSAGWGRGNTAKRVISVGSKDRNNEEAFETFFSIIERNKDFGKGKTKDAILSLFDIVGQKSELTAEYRGRLARILF